VQVRPAETAACVSSERPAGPCLKTTLLFAGFPSGLTVATCMYFALARLAFCFSDLRTDARQATWVAMGNHRLHRGGTLLHVNHCGEQRSRPVRQLRRC
jgi:hypothetical protein